MTDAVWFTWEEHRRSRELAAKFGARYLALLSDLPNPVRYLVLGLRTMASIASHRPRVIYCQNPSIMLAFLLCATRFLHQATVVVDRHTNFYFEHASSRALKWRIHNFLGRWTDRHANLVIVTNEYLAGYVRSEGGQAAVLPDPLPDIAPSERVLAPDARARVLFVGSGGADEPLEALLGAAAELGDRIDLTITSGGAKRAAASLPVPPNVRFPGFLPYPDYVQTLRDSDVVVVLTTMDHTLCCGAYEATSLHRPMVLSDTPTIRDYFSSGAVYTRSDADSIRHAIIGAIGDWPRLHAQICAADRTLRPAWQSSFAAVCAQIALTHSARRS